MQKARRHMLPCSDRWERLAAQLDGVRYEEEHSQPDRHLDEHGQTAAERADTIFGVQLHHLLLLLHWSSGLSYCLVASSNLGFSTRILALDI